ncbi:tRNA pseudouridine(55) synthase TruB [Peptococcus simiae]|uniref:tRNA pseudouridine(55) synthase TruB n=1 Tax=Peptococcus simiae TaxID=1643805 RepID=UPI0039804BE7
MINGILVIDKPAGLTSHDVVGRLRKVFKQKRVGHTGTLDPDATGVLPICLGQATRLAEYLTADDKSYQAQLLFGQATDTLDASGQVVEETDLPDLSPEAFAALLEGFLGEQMQIPPKYSAIKVDGVPLYKLARAGKPLPEVKARQITIKEIQLHTYDRHQASFSVTVSKGTYIRSLCADIGQAAGSSAHMTSLRRLSSGQFDLSQAIPLATLETAVDPTVYIIPMHETMKGYPQLALTEEEQKRVQHGNAIPLRADAKEEGGPVVASHLDKMVAIGFIKDAEFQPKKVFND